MPDTSELRKTYAAHQQGQVFQYWDELNAEQQKALLAQATDIAVERLNSIYKKAVSESQKNSGN
jgi:hypothetical protein